MSFIKTVLLNGVEITYQKIPSSNTVYLEAGFLAGLFLAEIEKQQIPHILEHLILRNFNSKNGEFRKNGKTNNLLTTFSFENTPNSFAQTLHQFISIFEDFNFSENDLRIQKNIIKNELLDILSSKNPENYKEILKNQNIPALTIQEEIETLAKITKNDILEFYKNYFSTRNLKILIIGNFAENTVLKAFENIKISNKIPIQPHSYEVKNSEILKNSQNLLFYTRISTLNRLLNLNERVVVEVILTEIQSKIYQNLRKNGLAYSFSAIFSEGSVFNNSVLAFESKIEQNNLEKFKEIIEKELSKIRKISKNNFNKAKIRTQNKLIFETQTPSQIAKKQRIRFLNYGDFIDFGSIFEKLTVEDFQDLASRFFD